MIANPEATEEKILKAVDLYLHSMDGKYQYLQRADYFIYKREGAKEEVSRLSMFLDEVDNGNSSTGATEWTTNLK